MFIGRTLFGMVDPVRAEFDIPDFSLGHIAVFAQLYHSQTVKKSQINKLKELKGS